MGVDFTTDLLIYTTICRENVPDLPEDINICLYLKELMVENEYPYFILSGYVGDIFSEIEEWQDKYSLNNIEDLKTYYEEDFDTEEDVGVLIISRAKISVRYGNDIVQREFDISALEALLNVKVGSVCSEMKSYLY